MGRVSLNNSNSLTYNTDNKYYQGILSDSEDTTMDVKVRRLYNFIKDRREKDSMDSESESIILTFLLSLYIESKLTPTFEQYLKKMEDHWINYSHERR